MWKLINYKNTKRQNYSLKQNVSFIVCTKYTTPWDVVKYNLALLCSQGHQKGYHQEGTLDQQEGTLDHLMVLDIELFCGQHQAAMILGKLY